MAAIRDENTSTGELLRDSRYHRASLLADPETKELAGPVKDAEARLRQRRDAHEAAEDARIEKLANLNRTDYVLDDHIRIVDLEVLVQVGKNREDARYRAVVGRGGAAAIIAQRGEEQALSVRGLVGQLVEHFPDLAKRHKATLMAEAEATSAAEKAWKQAEADEAQAMTAEVLARRDLVRQLQKNEGALQALFPGDKRRVRSYFRPKKRGGGASTGGGEGGGGTADG